MSGTTGIQWTDVTWNPTVGCTRVSSGCDHCYAFDFHDRRMYAPYIKAKRAGREVKVAPQFHQPFSKVQLMPERLEAPLHWRKPRRVFVNSVSDLFHEDVPDAFIEQVFGVMAKTPQHTYQILTKRPERMLDWMRRRTNAHALRALGEREYMQQWPLQNVWLGVSVENQAAADERIPLLLQTPAAVRFLSCEPLLGPVDLSVWLRLGWICELCYRRVYSRYLPDGWELILQSAVCPDCRTRTRDDGTGIMNAHGGMYATTHDPRPFAPGLSWCIIGGESGPHARPMDLAWARSLVEQCRVADVPVFMKQLGSVNAKLFNMHDRHGGDINEWHERHLLPALDVREFPQTTAVEVAR